jgi:hypothetical protein
MIKAIATAKDGRTIMTLGLSRANLEFLLAKMGDGFIKVDGREMGLPIDVTIFSGETEAAMADMLAPGMGPDTKIHISNKLKF